MSVESFLRAVAWRMKWLFIRGVVGLIGAILAFVGILLIVQSIFSYDPLLSPLRIISFVAGVIVLLFGYALAEMAREGEIPWGY